MPHRLRLLWSLTALVAVLVATLALAAPTRQPRAIAAVDCRPAVGDQMLGTALLHVPKHPRTPLPLVLAFHGAGGDGPGMASYSGLSATADKYGFAVLYPTAGSSHHFWSLNTEMYPNDVAKIRTLLPQAEQAACADVTRIYATGVSNGGGFAARLGCELAGTIAAIAPVAGGYKALDPCPGGAQTSVLEIHGTSDQVVPYDGKPPDYKGAVSGFLAGWVKRDGCDAEAVHTRPETNVLRFTHPGCDPGLAVEHLRLTGTDHGWPGAAPPWPHHNPSQLEANEEVWKFFSKHQLVRSASVGESRAARSAG
jgi:polyhydroxybutyrate depolymerase